MQNSDIEKRVQKLIEKERKNRRQKLNYIFSFFKMQKFEFNINTMILNYFALTIEYKENVSQFFLDFLTSFYTSESGKIQFEQYKQATRS